MKCKVIKRRLHQSAPEFATTETNFHQSKSSFSKRWLHFSSGGEDVARMIELSDVVVMVLGLTI